MSSPSGTDPDVAPGAHGLNRATRSTSESTSSTDSRRHEVRRSRSRAEAQVSPSQPGSASTSGAPPREGRRHSSADSAQNSGRWIATNAGGHRSRRASNGDPWSPCAARRAKVRVRRMTSFRCRLGIGAVRITQPARDSRTTQSAGPQALRTSTSQGRLSFPPSPFTLSAMTHALPRQPRDHRRCDVAAQSVALRLEPAHTTHD